MPRHLKWPSGPTPEVWIRTEDDFESLADEAWIPLSRSKRWITPAPEGGWRLGGLARAIAGAHRVLRGVGLDPQAGAYVVFADDVGQWWAYAPEPYDTLPYFEGTSRQRPTQAGTVKAWHLSFGLTTAYELPAALLKKVDGSSRAVEWAITVLELDARGRESTEDPIDLAFEAGQRLGEFEAHRVHSRRVHAEKQNRLAILSDLLRDHPEWPANNSKLARLLKAERNGADSELKARLQQVWLPDERHLARELGRLRRV